MPQLGREVFIVGAVRTPVGRGHPEKGMLRDVHPADLLGRTYTALLDRTAVEASQVDNVIAGCVYQIGEQSVGIARNAWLQKGLPETTGATTLDIRCGSGQQALHFAALRVAGGIDDVAIAGGVEHMGRVGFRVNEKAQEQWGRGFTPELLERFALVSQGEGAERIADEYEIDRDAMDSLAAESHRRAAAATDSGAFEREIVPLQVGDETLLADQGICPDSTTESLAGLRTVFRENGRVTAGNSSQVSDGAAALMVMSGDKAESLGVRPRARVVDQVTLGVDPVTMLKGPIPATERILERNDLSIDDLDVIEVNEAFASVVIAWQKATGADMMRVNPRGGAIAIGHPLGSTGARLLTTLLHELEDTGGRYGLLTMCCGGGLGTATLIERVDA